MARTPQSGELPRQVTRFGLRPFPFCGGQSGRVPDSSGLATPKTSKLETLRGQCGVAR